MKPPELPTGLDPAALLAAARAGGNGTWEPPAVELLAKLLPEYDSWRFIGRGGMGAVYECRQISLGRRVALKLLPAEAGEDPGLVERFRREASVLARLQHPNLLEIYDSGGTTAGHLWFTMELVEGDNLAQRLARAPIAVAEAVAIIRQACDALEVVHREGVFHRDLKPANVLLTRDGRLKLADFGIAGLAGDERINRLSRLTLTGTALGTLEYAAPEQFRGRSTDARADIFSLGVMAYEVLTGRLPRGVFDPPSAASGVDPAFDAVILTALQADPERRFASVADFRAAWLRAADARWQAETRERELRSRLRRRTRLAASLAGAVVLVAALAGWGWWQQRRAESNERVAVENRADAEKLVNYLMVGFRRQLNDVGRQDLLDELQVQLGDYFERVPDASDTHGWESRRQFLSERLLVATQQSRFADALADARRATDLDRRLLEREPENELRRRQLVEGQVTAGLVLNKWLRAETNTVRRDELLRQSLEMMATARADAGLLTNVGASPAALTTAAGAYRRTAFVLKTAGQITECEPYWNTARILLDAALAAQSAGPDADAAKDALAVLHDNLASAALERKDFSRALDHAVRFESLSRGLLPTNALNVMVHGQFAEAQARVGETLAAMNRQAEALEKLEAAVKLWDQLVPIAGQANPYPVTYRARALGKLALIYEESGLVEEAARLRDRARRDEQRAADISQSGGAQQ